MITPDNIPGAAWEMNLGAAEGVARRVHGPGAVVVELDDNLAAIAYVPAVNQTISPPQDRRRIEHVL